MFAPEPQVVRHLSKGAEIFRRETPNEPLEWTGERLTTTAGGQVEIEHLHRYTLARDFCRGLDVLDVASGEGYGTALLAQVARSAVGVEYAPEAAGHAALNYRRDNLRYLNGDARALPLPDQSVDIVVSFETIEHFYEQEQFLAEVKRVLRPGGRLLISSPDRDIYSPPGSEPNPYHVRELSRPEFQALLDAHFNHVRMLCQRTMLGSVLLADGPERGPTVTIERRGPHYYERSDGVPRPMYLLAVASDAAFDPIPNSIFVETGEIGAVLDRAAYGDGAPPVLAELTARAEAAEAALRSVQAELASSIEQAHTQHKAARAEIAAAIHQIEDIDQRREAAERQLSARPLHEPERDAALRERDAALHERDQLLIERDTLQSTLDEAVRHRDTARLALRRAAIFAENGWRTRTAQAESAAEAAAAQAHEAEQRLHHAEHQVAEWRHAYFSLRAKLDRLLRKTYILQLSRLVPRPIRQAIRARLSRGAAV